jgi:hypothetical protein
MSAERESELRAQLRPEVQSGLIARLERFLDLDRWGFRLNYVHLHSGRKVIYDSPSCRVKFSLLIDLREGDEIGVWYARSHVPDDVDLVMDSQGERCFAWHNIMVSPYWEFLEGSSAQEAAEHFLARFRWPLHAAFSATELGRTLQGVEWSVAQEGFLWQHYGERLFSLFDVRRPELWEVFRRFLHEYYELLPDHPFIRRNREVWGIPPWSVC